MNLKKEKKKKKEKKIKCVNILAPKVICQLIMQQEERGITRCARSHNWLTVHFNSPL